MKNLFRFPKKSSFIHYSGWGFSCSYISENPSDYQSKLAKNANKVISKNIRKINAQAFRDKQIRTR